MSFRLLGDRVAVRLIGPDTRPSGGVLLPPGSNKSQQGEVVHIGPGARLDNGFVYDLKVSPGDRVLFGNYSGVEVTVDGERFLVMGEKDIIAVL